VNIDQIYEAAFHDKYGDIRVNLDAIVDFVSRCETAAEFGVREGGSTAGILKGHPKKLVSYDINPFPLVAEYAAAAAAEGIEFVFKQQDDCLELIEPVDFLFIDAEHTYDQIHKELQMHSGQVKKYIGFHDTFWELSTQPVPEKNSWELWRAINELVDTGKWFVVLNRFECNGMTFIERVE